MSDPSTSANANSDNDWTDYHRKKWESIFSSDCNLFFDEELDYEYSDGEDIASSFPLPYTWSPGSSVSLSNSSSRSSSPASPRASSPTSAVIDLTSEDGDGSDRQRTVKKLTRDFTDLYRIRQESLPPQAQKRWQKNADFKGILKRWRIRSLDVIFMAERQINCTPQVSERTSDKKIIIKKPLEEENISDVSIIINNDLYSTSGTGFAMPKPIFVNVPPKNIHSCQFATESSEPTLLFSSEYPKLSSNSSICDISVDKLSPATAAMQEPSHNVHRNSVITSNQYSNASSYKRVVTNLSPECHVTQEARMSGRINDVDLDQRWESVSNLLITQEMSAPNPESPFPVMGEPSTICFDPVPIQHQRSVPDELQEFRESVNSMQIERPRSRAIFDPSEIFCSNFLNSNYCYNRNCTLGHVIPTNFEMTLNTLDLKSLMKFYNCIRKKPVFPIFFSYFAAVVSLKGELSVLLNMIDDVLPVDIGLVNVIIKNMFNLGLRFREAMDTIISHGVSDKLNDYLLTVLTTKNLDHWDLIVKLFNQRRSRVPIIIVNNILSLIVCQSLFYKHLCNAVNHELFERQRIDTRSIPYFLYNSFLQILTD